MKILRVTPRLDQDPGQTPAGHCHDCHNTSRWLITFGRLRPDLRLCERCASYLGGTLLDRIAERKTQGAG